MRNSLVAYFAIVQLAAGPIVALLVPGFRRRYLATPRWMLAQIAIAFGALGFLAILAR